MSKLGIWSAQELRLQMDTALRFYASFLVDKPHEFAMAVFEGRRVRDLRDKHGKRMTNAYLVEKLGLEFDRIPRVYERTCAYVHFSSTHMMAALRPGNEDPEARSIELKISSEDKPLPEELYTEAVDAFGATTDILLKYIHGWAYTKDHPEIVQRLRNGETND